MKHFFTILFVVMALTGRIIGHSQGFVNLNFESANISGYPPGSIITVASGFPGWTVSAAAILYDGISLSGDSISLIDSNDVANYPSIQGKYFVLLLSAATTLPGTGPVSIGQTGEVPASAESITFWGDDQGLQITFAGQLLSFNAIGSTANYTIYSADISAFAGQTGQLLFTANPQVGGGEIDNIQFSSSPVPEPGIVGLGILGSTVLGLRCWRYPNRPIGIKPLALK